MEHIRSQAILRLLELYADFGAEGLKLGDLARGITARGCSKPTAYSYAHAILAIREINVAHHREVAVSVLLGKRNGQQILKELGDAISAVNKAREWLDYPVSTDEKILRARGYSEECYKLLIQMKRNLDEG